MLNKKVRRQATGRIHEKEYSRLIFEYAIDLVITAKRSEGLRERSLHDYTKKYGYFVKMAIGISSGYSIR